MPTTDWAWPESDRELAELQVRLATAADRAREIDPWLPSGERPLLGGCFVAAPRGTTGPGRPDDRVWAAAVAWRPAGGDDPPARRSDLRLRRTGASGGPRQADDVLAQHVVTATVPAGYAPGLLARREGPVLCAALQGLGLVPDLVLVNASGLDHPRGAGLAVHLGAVTGLPTVGVTRRPLLATGSQPELRRGAVSPLWLADRCVAFRVCTRTGSRPLVAHGGWRTTPATAARLVLASSTSAARTPVPLQEARRVAREARALVGG